MPVDPPPSYQGSSASTTTSGNTPDDIFNLGNLYGQPVYLGETPSPTDISGPITDKGVETPTGTTLKSTSSSKWGKSQDIITEAVKLYGQQAVERKKNPGKLTSFEELQHELWQAGFYGQTSFDSVHVGQWTSQTEGAVKSAITSYEQVRQVTKLPMTFTDYIAQNQAGIEAGGENAKTGTGSGSTVPSVNLTDPASIKSAAQSAALSALGHGLSDDQLQKFVDQFQSAQTTSQSAPAGATATTPDLSSQADVFAQSADPQGYKQNQKQAYVSALVNLFAGPGDAGRPSQTPVPSAT